MSIIKIIIKVVFWLAINGPINAVPNAEHGQVDQGEYGPERGLLPPDQRKQSIWLARRL